MKTIKYYTFSWIRSTEDNSPDEIDESTIENAGKVTINPKYVIKVQRINKSPISMVLVDEGMKTEKYWTDYEGYQLLKNPED